MLTSWKTVPSSRRRCVIILLNEFTDFRIARELEAQIHCISRSVEEYIDKAQQIVQNIKLNPQLTDNYNSIMFMNNIQMSKGTIIEDIEKQTEIRQSRFEQMLQEKYDMLNDKSFNATLKCRRCGSSEVSWEQKQTRSADEASTVFCTCSKCNNRWKMK